MPYLKVNNTDSVQEVSARLQNLERYAIGQMLWQGAISKPGVWFTIAYSDDSILLKYFVQESALRVSYTKDNSPVHMDSCVEFFISFDNNGEYYNLEFNCIGTCSFGFGKSKSNREYIPGEVTSRIRRQALIESNVDGGIPVIRWELTLVIPFEVFIFHEIHSLKGIQCRANLYKCGDALPEPHFLSWQKVVAEEPNFHLPEFFGNMQFV